jgi:hypothetical protein
MTLDAVRARVIQIISAQQLQLTADQAARRTDEYIKFMQLKVEHLAVPLAPSHVVDKVWHSHLLDTLSYQQLQTVLMPDGGFIHHNPVLAEQNYELRYANTLSLLTKKYGEIPRGGCWDQDGYKKLNTMVASVAAQRAEVAGPQVYCHRQQTVQQLVESIKLVQGYTPADRIIISGMDSDCLPKSTHEVINTELWRSGAVLVTRVDAVGDGANTTGDNGLRYLRFQNETAEIEVRDSVCSWVHTQRR